MAIFRIKWGLLGQKDNKNRHFDKKRVCYFFVIEFFFRIFVVQNWLE